jgi:archaellin
MKINTKGEMGIGTLIIFIALLLVAAVAAGVLIQTAGSLQERALTTGDQAKSQISTNIRVTEVSGSDGSDGNIEEIEQIIKLSPGSSDIKLEQTLLTMNTYDRSATLTFRGVGSETENSYVDGFYTLSVEVLGNVTSTASNLAEDYDLDGSADQVLINSGGFLHFVFSSGENYTLPGVNCSGAAADVTTSVVASSNFIESVVIVGECGNDEINTTDATVTVTPKNAGDGFFTIQYLQRGTNPVAGNLQTGDVVKVFYEAPRAIGEDEEVRINFIPKIGTPTLTQFITAEVISTQRVYLYP